MNKSMSLLILNSYFSPCLSSQLEMRNIIGFSSFSLFLKQLFLNGFSLHFWVYKCLYPVPDQIWLIVVTFCNANVLNQWFQESWWFTSRYASFSGITLFQLDCIELYLFLFVFLERSQLFLWDFTNVKWGSSLERSLESICFDMVDLLDKGIFLR